MKLLVTGGAGYVGSVVAVRLVEAGHDVTVLDDLSTGHAAAVAPGARFIQAAINDAAAVLRRGGFEAVLHFAAKSLAAESVKHPDRYWRDNVAGTLVLLDAMRAAGVGRLVFSSTAATYGEPDATPIVETAPAHPANPYGSSKLAVDLMLADHARAFGLAAVSLRYFNVAGALLGKRGGYGERHCPETHLIPIALSVVTGERPQLDVYGTDYPTPDGTCIRDYVHVVDLAEAHIAALRAVSPGQHEVINLGSNTGYSVLQVVHAVRSETGHPLPTRDVPRRAGDPAVLVASNDRAAHLLGWKPLRGLREMVRDAWAFAQGTPQ